MVRAAALIFALVAAPTLAQVHIKTIDEVMRDIAADRVKWDREHMPADFDEGVWHAMTRDQQIDVQAAIETDPRPLAADTQAAVKDLIKGKLRDPDSAQFRDIRRRGPLDYCGWVNAKNGFGGYVGYSVFFANSKWSITLPSEASSPNLCPKV